MSHKRFIPLVLIFAVGVSGATTGVTQLTREDRTRVETVLRQTDTKTLRIPKLQPNLSKQEVDDAVTELEIGFRRMKKELPSDPSGRVAPAAVHEGIRVWESLSSPERAALLRGEPHAARVWTPAAMFALAAAKFIYDVGKDHCWWGKKDAAITSRPVLPSDLDVIREPPPKPNAMLQPDRFDERALNYQ